MIILNDRGDDVFFSDYIAEINIHSDGKRIMATSAAVSRQSFVIGTYENKRQTEKAFGMLVSAIAAKQNFFKMPEATDPELNTVTRGGGIQKRKLQTAGKTK